MKFICFCNYFLFKNIYFQYTTFRCRKCNRFNFSILHDLRYKLKVTFYLLVFDYQIVTKITSFPRIIHWISDICIFRFVPSLYRISLSFSHKPL